MIEAIAAHFCIGLGGLACAACGQKFCRHRAAIVAATVSLLLIEAVASVILIG